MSGFQFKQGDNISKEEFLAQFGDETEELVIKVFLAWEKSRQFPKIGDEYLANIQYDIPWERENSFVGYMGFIYWYCRKKPFGYPFPPKFREGCYYRIRARKCLYSPNTFLLEKVLASDVKPENDKAIYDRVVSGLLSEYETTPEEITVFTEKDISVIHEVMKYKGVVGICSCPVISTGDGADETAEGSLVILHDNKQFKQNRWIVLKQGTICKLLVRRRKGSASNYLLERILETNVRDTALKNMGESIINDSIWSIEGVGDFTITRRSGHSEASGQIVWKTVRTESGDADRTCYISLACDDGSPLTAVKSTKILKEIFSDRAAWEKKIYDYIADECAGDDGTIETWADVYGNAGIRLAREEFTDRLCICYIYIDEDDFVEISVDMDGMFSDNTYKLGIAPDGTISSDGLENYE